MHELGVESAPTWCPGARFEEALRLCLAFWPMRWSRVAVVVAMSLGHEKIAPEELPEFLDELTKHFEAAPV